MFDVIKRNLYEYDNDFNKIKILEEMINLLKTDNISEEEIINTIINEELKNKNIILNNLAVIAYNKELYDLVIPFLKASYEIDENSIDTLYNFSLILSIIGEENLAVNYYNKLICLVNNNKNKELIESIISNYYLKKLFLKTPNESDILKNLEIISLKSDLIIFIYNNIINKQENLNFTIENYKNNIKNNIKMLIENNLLEYAVSGKIKWRDFGN